jgi:hypothetical protein
MSEPLYFEHKVADRLGIARRDLKSVCAEILTGKKNAAGKHGREVVLTESGLERVLKHLRMALPTSDFDEDRVIEPGEKKEGEPPALVNGHSNGLTELTVYRTYPNPRLLEALTDTEERVQVLVKNNINFRPKMKLQARLVRPGRYELEGRCPRFPGRY